MTSAAVLPPVTEALSLLDVSFVNNEWHGTPATIRRSVQILVDHVSMQHMQLSRMEDILAAFGSPTQQGGTVWSKLAAKADLSRLEQLESQVDGLLTESAQLRTQQIASVHAHEDVMGRMELMRDQMGSLDARLGGPCMQDSSTQGIDQYGGRRAAPGCGWGSPSKLAMAAAGCVVPSVPSGSLMDRITRLERRSDALVEINAKTEDEAEMLAARLREMEPRMEVQINHLRSDIKQALALAAASTRMEADAETTSRIKETEKRLTARMQSIEVSLESKVSAVSTQAATTITVELDRRVNAMYDHVDVQVQRLSTDIDRLSRDKIDLTALEHYSQRISALFEEVSAGLADEVAALSGQLRNEVAGLAHSMEEARSKDKTLQDSINADMEGMRQLSSQVKDGLAAMQDTLSATPRQVEEAKSTARQAMADTEQLHKAVAGLNTAMSSTGSALELQSNKMGQLSHRISGLQHDIASLKDTLYGGAAAGASVMGNDGGAGTSLLSKVASLERVAGDITAAINEKAEDSIARELERRLATLSRQQDVTCEGLRTLSATAFKRSDEHASAIQRLTLAVSGNLEERPTTTAVKHMIETAALEVRERCDNALAPLWDAVRILQSGLRDAAGELKAVGSSVNNLQQGQHDSRNKLATDRASMMGALRKALDEEVGSLRNQLESRLDVMEGDVRSAAEQLEVHAQLQDRLTSLTTAVEEQLATQVAAWRAGNQQLRAELLSRVEAASNGLSKRLEAAEVASKQHSEDLKTLAEACGGRPNEAAVRDMATSVVRSLLKQELSRYAENDDAKWQAWLEEYRRTLEHLSTSSELAAATESACRQLKQELDSAGTTRSDELRRAFTSLRGEVEGRMRATTSRVEVAELRVQDLEVAVSGCAQKKEMDELLASSKAARADCAGLDARVRHLAADLEDTAASVTVLRAESVSRSEMAVELARKVDLATYLAQGSARAAVASAGALIGANKSPPSPTRQRATVSHERSNDAAVRLLGAAAAARAAERLSKGAS